MEAWSRTSIMASAKAAVFQIRPLKLASDAESG
ncbi:MAG: hypothetical protein ACI87E_002260 [Mariniblastus sp.]|jgi:hypothetical protein